MGAPGSRTISDHWRSLLKKDWQSVGDAVAAIAAQWMNVTAGTSGLNQQLITKIHPPPVKVEGLMSLKGSLAFARTRSMIGSQSRCARTDLNHANDDQLRHG